MNQKSILRLGIMLILFHMLIINHAQSQCRLDKSLWKVVFDEQFNENTTDELFKATQTDKDPDDTRNNGNVSWMIGEKAICPYPCICYHLDENGNTVCDNNNLQLVKDVINMHPDFDPQNPDALGLALFGASKNNTNVDPGPEACIPANSTNYWLGSEISSLHDDFPKLIVPSPERSRPGFVFGMFEIRCKLPKTLYSHSAFWLVANSTVPEIDAFETGRAYEPATNTYTAKNQFYSTIYWNDPINGAITHNSNFYRYDALGEMIL